MKKRILIVLFFGSLLRLSAQFEVSGQILNRSEFRNGYGRLLSEGEKPAAFIGQRSRIQVGYKSDKVNFFVSGQDVRTFGDVEQVNKSDSNFSIHEAYGEIFFVPKFSAKVGRQELVYDNVRFLGNLDWAFQARSHDIVLLKYNNDEKGLQIHGGYAFNQTGLGLTGTFYDDKLNQYKTAQFLWANKKINDFAIGFLLWNNGKQVDKTLDPDKTNYILTVGLPTVQYKWNDLLMNAFAYYQNGKNNKDRNVAAYDVSLDLNYTKAIDAIKGRKLGASAGVEVLSGTSQFTTNQTIESFDPMYGTNHALNGYMDYFYVGGRHANSVGLTDIYLKPKYDFNERLAAGIAAHFFSSAADMKDRTMSTPSKASSYLGTEVDLTATYKFTDAVSFQFGYSQMFASDSFKMLTVAPSVNTPTGVLEAVSKVSNNQNWAYLALLFRPGAKNKFSGLKW